MLPSIMKCTLIFLFLGLFLTLNSLKFTLYLSNKLNPKIITNPLLSTGTNIVLFTCNPAISCLVSRIPFSCLDDMTKLGSRLRTPSSMEISTIILPNALAGGTYSPPLSYLAPIQVQLAESPPFDEHTIYAFLPDNVSGTVKFLKIVSSIVALDWWSSIKFDGINILSF